MDAVVQILLDREDPVYYPGDARTLEDILQDIARNHLNISPVSIHLFALKQVGWGSVVGRPALTSSF